MQEVFYYIFEGNIETEIYFFKRKTYKKVIILRRLNKIKDFKSIMPKRSGSPDSKHSISNESEIGIFSNIIEKLPNDSTIIIKKPIKTKAE